MLLSAVMIFIIPAFSLWFFTWAEQKMDRVLLEGIEKDFLKPELRNDPQAAEQLAFWRRTPASKILASRDPADADLQRSLSGVSHRYDMFRWGRQLAVGCLGLAVAAFIGVGALAASGLNSAKGRYWGLKIGWAVLRATAILQVLGQGVLAVALSYWVTALWGEFYSIKLIAIIGLFAVALAAAAIKGLMAKNDFVCEADGTSFSRSDAPGLWARLDDMAQRLGTAPPDHIAAGIDANFFVTQAPVRLPGRELTGRTLYTSLPLLKALNREEADAVLAHEMAHFSGEDTLDTVRTGPLRQSFATYVGTLGQGPVFHYMKFFWCLFETIRAHNSRKREFRADRTAASLCTPQAVARALVKISAYCHWRHSTEQDVFHSKEGASAAALAAEIEQGFPSALREFSRQGRAGETEVPHPFDTHPPLEDRLAALGLKLNEVLADPHLHDPPSDSWAGEMNGAAETEAELWQDHQNTLESARLRHQLFTIFPDTPEHVALLEAAFPRLVYSGKKATVTLDCSQIHHSDWPAPVPFSQIAEATVESGIPSRVLKLKLRQRSLVLAQTRKLLPAQFQGGPPPLLEAFGTYYNRWLTAEQYRLAEQTGKS